MEAKKSLLKQNKVRLIGIVLVAVLLMSMIPMISMGNDDHNISQKNFVTIDKISISAGGEDYLNITPGQAIDSSTLEQIGYKNSLGFKVNWHITAENCDKINKDDYFEVIFPSYLTIAVNSIEDLEATVTDENGATSKQKIGTFEISKLNSQKDSPLVMRITFDDLSKYNGITKGYMEAYGRMDQTGSDADTVTIGNTTIPKLPLKKQTGTFWGDSGKGSVFNKGTNNVLEGEGKYYYSINVNTEDMMKRLKGQEIDEKKNVYVVDDFPDGMYLKESNIAVQYGDYIFYSTDKASWQCISDDGGKKVTNQLHNFGMVEEGTEEQFMEMFEKHDGPAYGVYMGKKLVVKLGDMPGTLKTNTTWEEFQNKVNGTTKIDKGIEQMTQDVKEYTIDAFRNIYNGGKGQNVEPNGNAKGDLVGVNIYFWAYANGSNETMVNSATMTYDGGSQEAISTPVKYTKASAGAEGLDPGSVKIIKKDSSNDEIITGVGFTIQKEVNGVFENITTSNEQFTDEKGEVLFKNLKDGNYKIVESTPKAGYTTTPSIVNEDGTKNETHTFTVDAANQKKGFTFTAYNDPIKDETTQGAILGDEDFPSDSTQEGNVLGESKNPEESGKVLGDEAKTSDVMNVVPLLIILAVMALLILAIAKQSSLRKE